MIAIIYALICIGALALNIVLIVKFWSMAGDVKAIRDLMETGKAPGVLPTNNVGVSPSMMSVPAPAPMPSRKYPTAQNVHSKDDLMKGKNYNLGTLGVCTYEGMYEGKYSFYPIGKIDRTSAYFRDDVEPYYLIPESDLGKVLL